MSTRKNISYNKYQLIFIFENFCQEGKGLCFINNELTELRESSSSRLVSSSQNRICNDTLVAPKIFGNSQKFQQSGIKINCNTIPVNSNFKLFHVHIVIGGLVDWMRSSLS